MEYMAFCYDKLWELIYINHLNKTSFRDKAGITNSTLSRLSKNETVSMEVLGRICDTFECNIEDIVEYRKEIM